MSHRKRSSPPPALPRVALFVETQTGVGRDTLRGIARFARESGPWALRHEPRFEQFHEGWVPSWLNTWKGSGIIGRFGTDTMVNAVRQTRVPAVDLLGQHTDKIFPQVYPDDVAIGRLAAEHLLERGFRQFGFIGWRHANWSDSRRSGFVAALNENGAGCNIFELSTFENLAESWDAFIEEATQWVIQQPKPMGLMLCYDQIGPPVTQACREAGVAVPEEVAIVGVDNDEPICAICDPPLTSVCPNHEEVGYQAAALLDRIMTGQTTSPRSIGPIVVPPRAVEVRQSSNVLAITDPIISAALSMIREHACNGLQVSDVAERVPVSRSVLQRRFQTALKCSVHDEILRVQLEKAQELLRESDLSIRSVAEKSGFRYSEYMAAVFKARIGTTPGKYRRKFQPVRGEVVPTVAASAEDSDE
jgi:LacI family transcriptional regulator